MLKINISGLIKQISLNTKECFKEWDQNKKRENNFMN